MPILFNAILTLLAIIVIALIGYVCKRYDTLRNNADAHGMGKPISAHDWKIIMRDKRLEECYLAGVRKARMLHSIEIELHGKPKVWAKRDHFGLITEIRWPTNKPTNT